MKKLIFTFFIIFSISGLSNPIFDSLIGPRWNCSNLSDNQLIFLVISKDSENKYSAALNLFNNLWKKGPLEISVRNFDLAINEKEQYFHFTNLNKKSQIFSTYRFNYTVKNKKKNKVKFSLYDTSKNRTICEFYS